ncbi:MAG TPA: glycosyl hydrolase, partial [Myxococcota bacterium]|nr:glycosyl hydrolase [Myxococcota bacterium]
RDTRVSWSYDEATGVVRTTFEEEVDVKEPSLSPEPLMGLFPHQWKHTDVALTPHQYATSRGVMRLMEGHRFTTELTFHGILPTLPDVGAHDRARLQAYLGELPQTATALATTADTYTSGKAANKYAQALMIACQVGSDDVRDATLSLLKGGLQDWFSATGDSAPLFAYLRDWGTVVGYPAGFGSDAQLNDHHFHWGYLIGAAAAVALHDPDWGKDSAYGGLVKLLVRDTANPVRGDALFPFLRQFDPYEGHSWASGHANFEAGNNQESSSEAMHFAASLILWGEATGNRTIRDLGVYLYTTEGEAIAQYWFNADGTNFPAGAGHPVYTILWSNGGSYATWWTAAPEAIHGIEFMPLTGASLYLGRRPEALETSYTHMVQQIGGPEGSKPSPDAWVDIIWNAQALYDPNAAIAKFEAQANTYAVEAGESRAHTYHWLYSLAALGPVDASITANTATYAVFGAGSARTYVAYNAACDAAREVTFSDGTKLQVPPHTLLAWRGGQEVSKSRIGSSTCAGSGAPACTVSDTGLGGLR